MGRITDLRASGSSAGAMVGRIAESRGAAASLEAEPGFISPRGGKKLSRLRYFRSQSSQVVDAPNALFAHERAIGPSIRRIDALHSAMANSNANPLFVPPVVYRPRMSGALVRRSASHATGSRRARYTPK